MRPRFFLAEAFRSIRANVAVSIAATVTVLIAVFILGAFIPSFLYVQSSVDSQKARVDIRAYISDSAKVAQVNELQNELVQLQQQGTVKSFVYINKDQALKELRGPAQGPQRRGLPDDEPDPGQLPHQAGLGRAGAPPSSRPSATTRPSTRGWASRTARRPPTSSSRSPASSSGPAWR